MQKEPGGVIRKSASLTLNPLLIDPSSKAKAAKAKRSQVNYRRFHISEDEEARTLGWEVVKRQKRVLVASKPKPVSQLLEDRVWCLFHDMGYPVLNGERFKVTFEREDGSRASKQIDVFAKDSETVAVVECKTRATRGRKTLQQDLHETAFLQKPIADAVRKHFGEFKPKMLWIYVTQNIIWSEVDLDRASSSNIRVITENELYYFEAYIGHVGSAGRYQFLAEFLQGQEIAALRGIKVPAVKGRFGKDTFYSFTIKAGHLLKLAFVNHHALNHPAGRPAYQRMVVKKRLREIGEFILGGGYFATNLLVNFIQKCDFEPLPRSDADGGGLKFGYLTLPDQYKSAWVIDGQHRLFGFTNLPEPALDQPLFVVAFEQLETTKEAELFITINHKQKSVSRGLLAALQADLQMGSSDPDEALGALASLLIRKLSADPAGPLFGRFEIPGVPPAEGQVLTIPEVQKGLRRSGLIGRIVKKNRLPGYLSGATDDDSIERARRTINGYFRNIEEAVPAKWLAGRSAHILTNPAIRAHLTLLNEVLRYQHARDKIDPFLANPEELCRNLVEFCKPMIDLLKTASDSELASLFARKYGEGGVKEYFFGLCGLISRAHSDFGPDEYRQYLERSTDERIAQAKLDVSDMTSLISTVVVETLKRLYGVDETPSGEKKYWEIGISDSGIKESAYKKQQQVKPEKRALREAYLDILDFEKIIRQKGNWETFRPIFSIPLTSVNPKSKEYHLDWIKEFNEVRNTIAHPSIYRHLEDGDYKFLDWLKGVLYDRCSAAGFQA